MIPFPLSVTRQQIRKLCPLFRPVLLWVIIATVSSPGKFVAAEDRKPIQLEDLYRLESPLHAAVAPEGAMVAYTRQWIDRQTKHERHSLWVIRDSVTGPQALEPGEPDARQPVFSPDGRWIAFRSTRPRPAGWRQTPPVPLESDPATDIWLIPTSGGTAIPLAPADKPYGRVLGDSFYGRVAFSPDSKQLVFVADDGLNTRTEEEREADVFVQRADQGEGYTGYRPAQIWVADLAAEPTEQAATKIRRLTDDSVWYGDPQWSPDGKTIVVHANRSDDVEAVRFSINKNFDLWMIDVATSALTHLTRGPGPEVSPRWSPDGRRLVCLSSPRKGPHSDIFNLLIVELRGGPSQSRVVYDHHAASASVTDAASDPVESKPPHPYPSFPLPDVTWDDAQHVVIQAPVKTRTELVLVNIQTGSGQLLAADVPTGSGLARRELAWRNMLLPPANPFLRERLLGETTVVTWKSSDQLPLEGVLTVPPAAVAQPPYPLVVYPHGGPHSRSTTAFNFTVELFAAHGYAVFQPNYRGSQGYGKKFLDANRRDFGGGDYEDIRSGIAALVERQIVAADRQFLYGISYGGFLTCWSVSQTAQFRAAVAQNAVTDLQAMWALSDIPSWVEWEFEGQPWSVAEQLRQHSPLTFVDQVKTPTLILHSREDRRCPLAMGQMFHQAMVQRQVPTSMVV
ncbi:MAG: prolyl oligopeptidase family serine peptidase, partial [Planctomycetota bacterium]